MKKPLLLFLFLIPFLGVSQQLNVAGTLLDTTSKTPVKHAIVMAIKLADSSLVNFTRTNEQGLFQLKPLPVDTYQVLITHPQFADQGFFIFGDKQNLNYNFGKIIAQPKSLNLEEVTVFAFKDPVYYKGDTLIYTADSFKVKANANVEDLLKKLPGMKVDADGKITAQGKKVDKVLVDGDEFFGGDPNIATKNLAANAIESVQVYEKKSDDASNSSSGEETQQVLNLKLKEDAKKGYFGKVSAGSDFQKFYEGEAMGNYFKNQLKISAFGLASNTPKSDLGWDDMYKYGLGGDFEWNDDDDYDWENKNSPQGIPQTFKSGIFFSNKFSSKTKLNMNYSYNTNLLNAGSETNTEYFLTDTSYRTDNKTNSLKRNEAHAINFDLEQKLDSLTELRVKSGIKFLNETSNLNNETDFSTSDFQRTRSTGITNNSQTKGYDVSTNIKLKRLFKKKDRRLNIDYSNALSKSNGDALLQTDNQFYGNSTQTLTAINQKKENDLDNINHNIGIAFTEPFGKKIKLETSYDFMYYNNNQDKKSLNSINGEYTALDSNFTNHFINIKQINRAGLKFIYEVKKLRFIAGSKVRHVAVNNNNVFLNSTLTQNFNNILPFASVRIKPNDNKHYSLSYKLRSDNPTINQLQPVLDNSNQNFVNIGNPNLLPTQEHQFNVNYNSWKPISGKYYWAGGNYNFATNDFANATLYDSIGRTISQTINVNGNYAYSSYVGMSLPFFSKVLSVEPNVSANYNSNKNFVNNVLNNTTRFNGSGSLGLSFDFDSLTFSVKADYNYSSTASTLNSLSNKPFNTQNYSARFNWTTPLKFIIATDAAYTVNSNRSNGYNINYVVWNASLERPFLKTENLIIGFYAYDMLNQNINVVRNISSNMISDVKTNIISRYFLLKATFKFNNNNTKETDDWD